MVCKGKVTGDNMSSTLGSLKLTFLMFCLEEFYSSPCVAADAVLTTASGVSRCPGSRGGGWKA